MRRRGSDVVVRLRDWSIALEKDGSCAKFQRQQRIRSRSLRGVSSFQRHGFVLRVSDVSILYDLSKKRSRFCQKRGSCESDVELLRSGRQIFSQNRRRHRRLGGAKLRSQQIGREDALCAVARFALPRHFIYMVCAHGGWLFGVAAHGLLRILGFQSLRLSVQTFLPTPARQFTSM